MVSSVSSRSCCKKCVLNISLVFATIFLLAPPPCQSQDLPDRSVANRVQLRRREKQILDQILGGSYDSNIRPSGGNTTSGETQVTVNLMLNAVSKIDDFKMEYSVQLTLRKEWNDDRLRFAHMERPTSGSPRIKYLTMTDISRIWIPDVFFINEKDGHFHNIIKPNVYVRIFPDGHVAISIRMSLTLGCPMNLKLFPMDTQRCGIVMASYAWTTEDLDFQWAPVDAVQLPNLTLPRFSLKDVETSRCDRTTVSGTYSCLRVDFTLTRNFSFYLTQMYIPCILLVIVSWVSFWLDENAVPARTALGITTLLTMATQQANMNKNLPPVSYIKALDVWSGTCLLFIFAALLEFALVNYATRFDKRTKAKVHENTGHGHHEANGGGGGCSRCCGSRNYSTSKTIDVTARIVFPLLFIIFNVCYWVIYLVA